jgi:hypothetical protein
MPGSLRAYPSAAAAPFAPPFGGRPHDPGVNKRQKEKNRQDKQREKGATRKQRRHDRASRPAGESSLDQAIADIVPGPQPPSEDL